MSGVKTYSQLYDYLKKELGSAFEADQLLQMVTGKKSYEMLEIKNNPVGSSELLQLEKLVARRKSGEPLQYIIGNWDFYGLPFYVGEGVLIPRPDTEVLVETSLKLIKAGGTVLDLCSGSGAIAIAIAKNADVSVSALELSSVAFDYLKRNIALNKVGVTPILGDVKNYSHPTKVDLIVSNPPYITQNDMKDLQLEVQKEPEMALAGGKDGLDFYRIIAERYKEQLNPKGHLAFEVGIYQSRQVSDIMIENGYNNITVCKDLAGVERVVYGSR